MRDYKRRNHERLAARRRERYAADAGRAHREREQRRREQAPYRTFAQRMRASMRERARELSLPFDGDFFTVPLLMVWIANNPRCCVCRRPLDLTTPRNGQKLDASPSADRIVPSRGYTRTNVAIMCWRCNNLKRDASPEELEAVARWLRWALEQRGLGAARGNQSDGGRDGTSSEEERAAE